MFDEGRSTDWQDLITQSGVYQNYNLGITGGSEKTTYYLGGPGRYYQEHRISKRKYPF
jgi:hypothetical protein